VARLIESANANDADERSPLFVDERAKGSGWALWLDDVEGCCRLLQATTRVR